MQSAAICVSAGPVSDEIPNIFFMDGKEVGDIVDFLELARDGEIDFTGSKAAKRRPQAEKRPLTAF